ncbi:hypothetical protein [Streptomyces sp. NPDC058394]|uniref:hypothetical protein n=1 Tax=Streptomyces sp. NPDC058394 TaxID=3346477 RepID=UPI003656F0FB
MSITITKSFSSGSFPSGGTQGARSIIRRDNAPTHLYWAGFYGERPFLFRKYENQWLLAKLPAARLVLIDPADSQARTVLENNAKTLHELALTALPCVAAG